jgi:hypothetical protein
MPSRIETIELGSCCRIAQGKLDRVLPSYRRASGEIDLQLVYTSRPPVPPAVAVFAEFLMQRLGDAMPSAGPADASRP